MSTPSSAADKPAAAAASGDELTTAGAAADAQAASPLPSSSRSVAAPPASSASASQQPDMSKYGTHDCTCDGCNAKPITGFRYKCLRCRDHDVCESCHAAFTAGSLPHSNRLNPLQSRDVAAHTFAAYADGKSFRAMGGARKSEPLRKAGKPRPNDPCSCGSGKKYKRCHFMQQAD